MTRFGIASVAPALFALTVLAVACSRTASADSTAAPATPLGAGPANSPVSASPIAAAWRVTWTKTGGFAGTFQTTSVDASGAVTSAGRRTKSSSTLSAADLSTIAKVVAATKPESWRTNPDECCDRFYIKLSLQRGTKLWTEAWVGDQPHDAPADALALASALANPAPHPSPSPS